MNVLDSLDRLDGLIVEHMKGGPVARLRNILASAREQVEALQQEYFSSKNTHTVFKNKAEQTIADLEKEKAKAEEKAAYLKGEIDRIGAKLQEAELKLKFAKDPRYQPRTFKKPNVLK